jgi:hypothetical protein
VLQPWLPHVGEEWVQEDFDHHMRQLRATQAASPIDTLFVGSSSIGADILTEPLVRSGAVDQPYVLWNVAAPMRLIERATRDVVLRETQPTCVVVGVTMRELNDLSPSASTRLDAFVTDPAYRKAIGTANPLDDIDHWARKHSELARQRTNLRRPRTLFDLARRAKSVDAKMSSSGELDDRRDASLDTEHPLHRRAERNQLAAFAVGGQEASALSGLINSTREMGANVLLVNLPVTDIFIDAAPKGREDYTDYAATLSKIAAESGAHYWDAMTEPWQPELFADVNHLNGAGAQRFTSAIAAPLTNACG